MILTKLKQLFTTDLVKVSTLTAFSQVIRMITGFVSVKVVAVQIGPIGVALLGQLTNFILIIQAISNGGINAGMTKYLAQYSGSPKRYFMFLGTGFWITVFFSILCSIVLFIFPGFFAEKILLDRKYAYVFNVLGATIILFALNALLLAVINGFKEYRRYVIANILGSIIGLCFSVVLALNYNIPGALIAVATYQSVVFFLTVVMVTKRQWFKWNIIVRQFRKGIALKLGHFSLMAIASAVTIPAGQMIVRKFIVKNSVSVEAGLTEAGLWQGLNNISLMYLGIITASLGVYYLPRLAELKSNRDLKKEVFNAYKIIMPFMGITIFGIFLFRALVIKILFSKEFAPMQDLFAFQLIGDFLKIAGWLLGYLLIAKAMSKVYIIMEMINFILLIAASYFLVNSYGALGATIAYAIIYLIYFIVLLVVFRKLLFTKSAQ